MKASLLLSGAALAAFAGCTSDNVKCGDGTTKVGDTCEGGNTTCGAGTHLEGNACVPDAQGAGGAPTISKIDPSEAGLAGGGLFTITGTNLAGWDVSDLHVFFGDPTNMSCEAKIGAATPTAIAGEVPSACDFNVVVTVQTNKGSATTPFKYDAIIAVDGDAGGVKGQEGDLYIIDPFTQQFADLGPVYDTDGFVYGISGLAFSGTTLYAVSTGDSADGDFLDGASSLLTIDLMNGATWIGETMDSSGNPYVVTDIKSHGGVLYGLAYAGDPSTSLPANTTQFMVSIDPATGTVTKIGSSTTTSTTDGGGLAIDGTGKAYAAVSAQGSFDTVDMTTATHTSMITLDYSYNSPITSMTYFGTYLLAVVDNGTRGVELNDTENWSGETLVLIDPAADPNSEYYVTPWFQLPNRDSYKAMVDAIVVPPAGFTVGTGTAQLSRAKWTPLHAPTGTP